MIAGVDLWKLKKPIIWHKKPLEMVSTSRRAKWTLIEVLPLWDRQVFPPKRRQCYSMDGHISTRGKHNCAQDYRFVWKCNVFQNGRTLHNSQTSSGHRSRNCGNHRQHSFRLAHFDISEWSQDKTLFNNHIPWITHSRNQIFQPSPIGQLLCATHEFIIQWTFDK